MSIRLLIRTVTAVDSLPKFSTRRGDLRFRLPVANDPYTGVYNATTFGPSCIQQNSSFVIPDVLDPQAKAVLESGFGALTDVSDDCEFSASSNVKQLC